MGEIREEVEEGTGAGTGAGGYRSWICFCLEDNVWEYDRGGEVKALRVERENNREEGWEERGVAEKEKERRVEGRMYSGDVSKIR